YFGVRWLDAALDLQDKYPGRQDPKRCRATALQRAAPNSLAFPGRSPEHSCESFRHPQRGKHEKMLVGRHCGPVLQRLRRGLVGFVDWGCGGGESSAECEGRRVLRADARSCTAFATLRRGMEEDATRAAGGDVRRPARVQSE